MRTYQLGLPALGAAAAVAYWRMLLPWMRCWGTTGTETRAPLQGDELVEQPTWTMTHAVTVQADPAAVWPWLAQLGYRRGGLYSYDWLDRLFGFLDAPSADRILPEFQQLRAGDVIPLGRGPSWPVAAAEPGCLLILAPDAPGLEITWAFVLIPGEDGTTRLLSRVRAAMAPTLGNRLIELALDPTAFLMTRKMLLGIKQRAERQRLRVTGDPAHAARPSCNDVEMSARAIPSA